MAKEKEAISGSYTEEEKYTSISVEAADEEAAVIIVEAVKGGMMVLAWQQRRRRPWESV